MGIFQQLPDFNDALPIPAPRLAYVCARVPAAILSFDGQAVDAEAYRRLVENGEADEVPALAPFVYDPVECDLLQMATWLRITDDEAETIASATTYGDRQRRCADVYCGHRPAPDVSRAADFWNPAD